MSVSDLKMSRVRKGLSQYELSQQTRVPPWRISLIERGVAPTHQEAEAIATALETFVADLFPKSKWGIPKTRKYKLGKKIS